MVTIVTNTTFQELPERSYFFWADDPCRDILFKDELGAVVVGCPVFSKERGPSLEFSSHPVEIDSNKGVVRVQMQAGA